MEELFVQEPAVAAEKVKREKTSPAVEKKNDVSARPTYSHDEAVEASIAYFKGDELAARVWANKYSLKHSLGNLYEKPADDMDRRVASEIHRIEKKYKNPLAEDLIYNVLRDFKYIVPQGG